MSGPPPAPTQATRADPPQARTVTALEAAPTRTSHLLGFVRKLIDYGKHLAGTLRQGASAADLAAVTHNFGTIDIALILTYIARALLRATALEARLLGRFARDGDGPRPIRTAATSAPARRKPRPAQPPARLDPEADPRLALLPTPEQIAAEVRRRPIGAVIADICRDLGINGKHPLWRDVSSAIVANGGNFVRLFRDILKRAFRHIGTAPGFPPPGSPASWPDPCPPMPAASGAGPP